MYAAYQPFIPLKTELDFLVAFVIQVYNGKKI